MPSRERALRYIDIILAPLMVPAGLIMKFARHAGLHRVPLSRRVLLRIGVLPVRNHYYEPWVTSETLSHPLDQPRRLPGIDWRSDQQLNLLRQCTFESELTALEDPESVRNGFRFGNGMFEQGDAEMLYNLIRIRRPRRLIEIGSGNSTLVAAKAIEANAKDDPSYACEHTCIEPYENDWLDGVGVNMIREPVESIGTQIFESLEPGDILFIDSSHVIRPQGDVVWEYLEILPLLAPGVLVHIHDIYSPRDYPIEWVLGRHRFWNEQYLLEAFLSGSDSWQVVAAMNYLQNQHSGELRAACPHLRPQHQPGSFYIEKAA